MHELAHTSVQDVPVQTRQELTSIDKLLGQIKPDDTASMGAVIQLTDLTHKLKGTYEVICAEDMFKTCKALHLCAKAVKTQDTISTESILELHRLRAACGVACEVMFKELDLPLGPKPDGLKVEQAEEVTLVMNPCDYAFCEYTSVL